MKLARESWSGSENVWIQTDLVRHSVYDDLNPNRYIHSTMGTMYLVSYRIVLMAVDANC